MIKIKQKNSKYIIDIHEVWEFENPEEFGIVLSVLLETKKKNEKNAS